MKYLGILLSLLLTQNAYTKTCTYTISPKGTKVSWEAYKTPLKVGVKGSFKELGFNKERSGKSIEGVLTGAQFNIDTKSIFTGDKARDGKITKFFFESEKIVGEIVSADAKTKTLQLKVNMNGKEKSLPMKYRLKGKKLIADGFIDVLEFSMDDNLAALTKACFAKHEGKTWSDVKINLTARYSKRCK